MTLTSDFDLNILPFVIETEDEYDRALSIYETLFFKQDRTALENQILEVWTELIQLYEQKAFDLGSSYTPLSVLRHLMETQGMIQEDLVRQGIGSRGMISEIMNGKREISRDQARKLAAIFKVTADLFI